MGRAALARPDADDELNREELGLRGYFLLLAGDEKEAAKYFHRMCDETGDPWAGLQIMAISEAAHDDAARDAAVRLVIERGPAFLGTKTEWHLVDVMKIYQACFAAGPQASPDLAALDRMAAQTFPKEAADIRYFTARILEARGHSEDARRYYTLAAAEASHGSYSGVLAKQWLEAHGGGGENAE
jgi:hypothetical protein